jgi:SAM-dependent methyltransferase
MTALPFQSKFDAIISAFDSINYLLSKKSLEKLFNETYRLLSDNGIFTFDVSLEKNSLKSERFLNRKGSYNNIKYIQRSKFDSEKKIHFNKFELTFPDGRVEKEIHKQRIYPVETYFELLSNCGFVIQNCFDAFTFNDADEKSIRVQFVTIKGKRNA